MKTKELGQYAGLAAATLMLAASGLATAAKPAGLTTRAATSATVIEQALNNIRAEQRHAVRQAARHALAEQRSQTQAALSQGGTVSASTSVQAKP
ncbi:MAG: hypothetical protein M3O62_14810 [Pseudomonadota bacterium]|nr:hypothetical protein [Pseudomonadota bacterium]